MRTVSTRQVASSVREDHTGFSGWNGDEDHVGFSVDDTIVDWSQEPEQDLCLARVLALSWLERYHQDLARVEAELYHARKSRRSPFWLKFKRAERRTLLAKIAKQEARVDAI